MQGRREACSPLRWPRRIAEVSSPAPGAAELGSPVEEAACSAGLLGEEAEVLPGAVRRGPCCLSRREQPEGRKCLEDLGRSAALVRGGPSILLWIP